MRFAQIACLVAVALWIDGGLQPVWAVESVLDTLTLKGKKPVKGRFEGYRNGRFRFRPEGAEKALQELRIRVDSLELSPAARVSVSASGKGKREGVTLSEYKQGHFVFNIDGKTEKLSGGRVQEIKADLDFKRGGGAGGGGNPPMDRGPADLDLYIRKGVITVIHLHMNDSAASVQHGQYVSNLSKKNAGKMRVVRLTLKGWEDPAVHKYNVRSIPQFWIYDREGVLSGKLEGTFSADDIDGAILKAQSSNAQEP